MTWVSDEWPTIRARLMSGHMMPTERQATEATIEILELNEWLEDDVKCDVDHNVFPDVGDCSIKVTHILRDCCPARLVCGNAAAYVQRALGAQMVCECGEPVTSHVRLFPV